VVAERPRQTSTNTDITPSEQGGGASKRYAAEAANPGARERGCPAASGSLCATATETPMALSGRAREARIDRSEPTACNRTMTTAAANTRAHMVAEPAGEAPITLEEDSMTWKKEVAA